MLSIGLLSWRAHKTLRKTLDSYRASDLMGCADEFKVFFNEISEEDRALAAEYGVEAAGSPENLGIWGGMDGAAAALKGDYILLLQNDCPVVSSPEETRRWLRDGVKLLDNVSFIVGKEDKIAIIGKNELAVTMLFKILMGEEEPDSGSVKWGASTTQAYFPKDHNSYFENCEYDLMDWMRQFSEDKRESYLRTFLGRMLFSGDDVYKPVKVLSGGERVRCMISKMMLTGANVLVFDQPTNHLDLESIAALNNGMEAFKYNIIFSSHDHQLTQTVANRIIEITDDGIIDRMCSFDEYMNLTGMELETRS